MIGYMYEIKGSPARKHGCHPRGDGLKTEDNAMSSSQQQQHHHRTSMFARVVGPYLVIIAATAALRPIDMKALLSRFEANSLWAWVVGAFILLLGLVTIALHPYWQGAAASIVSVVGWLVALKGLMLVASRTHTFRLPTPQLMQWAGGGAALSSTG
jgi:hypothetical protein